MIKKSISGVIVLLIFIKSIGCYSKVYLWQEDIEKLAEGDKIVVTMQDRKTHDITVVRIEGTEIHGIDYTGGQKSQVVIHAEEISLIEMKKFDTEKTLLIGSVCIGAIAYGALIIPLYQIEK